MKPNATIVCARGFRGEQRRVLTDRDQEAVDRFAHFLRLQGMIRRGVEEGRWVQGQTVPAWLRYAVGLAVWRMEQV